MNVDHKDMQAVRFLPHGNGHWQKPNKKPNKNINDFIKSKQKSIQLGKVGPSSGNLPLTDSSGLLVSLKTKGPSNRNSVAIQNFLKKKKAKAETGFIFTILRTLGCTVQLIKLSAILTRH